MGAFVRIPLDCARASQIRRWPSGRDTEEKKWVARAQAVADYPHSQHDCCGTRRGSCTTIVPDLSCFVDGSQDGTLANYSLHINHYTLHASRESFAETKLVRGDVLYAAWDTKRDWKHFFAQNDKWATEEDVELRSKRIAGLKADQARLDALVCWKPHAGGEVPKWCARR